MYDKFSWTNVAARRNGVTAEYEPLQPFFLMALAERTGCGTFLDVGANIGAYSLFGTLVPTMKRVIAFEANPKTAEELRANVVLNNLQETIEVQPKAVSSAKNELSFAVISKFSGANSVAETSIHDRSTFHKQIRVEATTLDWLFPEPFDKPVCIKIDVEGHEPDVIEGAKATLESNSAVIQIEVYDRAAGRKLEELGYFRLTTIGPDQYFSNISELRDAAEIVSCYEHAGRELIAYNHRNKTVALKRGDFGLQLTGKSADIARSVAKRLIGKRL